VKVWDAGRRNESLYLRGFSGRPQVSPVLSLAFSPDGLPAFRTRRDNPREIGQRLVTASAEYDRPGEAQVWDAVTGELLRTLKGHTGGISSVGFSPDGKRILTTSSYQFPGVVLRDDGPHPATRPDNTLKLWDADMTAKTPGRLGQEVLSIQGHLGQVGSACFSPDGKRLLTGMRSDFTARVWDLTMSTEGRQAGSTEGQQAGGRQLLALQGHTGLVGRVAFSPDGTRLLTGSADRTAKVWDAATGQEIFTLRGHSAAVTGVCFSPDGARLATGSADQTVKVWDARTGREVRSLEGHAGPGNRVAFTADGQRLFAWGGQEKALAWSAADGKPLPPDNPPAAPLGRAGLSPGSWSRVQPDETLVLNDGASHTRQNLWPLPDAAERRLYHTDQAALAEKEKRWFAVAFHLGRLLLDSPDDADLKRRREQALQAHAAQPEPELRDRPPPRMERVP
jgi:WD40 repeat protein